jgi:hypothetical protein
MAQRSSYKNKNVHLLSLSLISLFLLMKHDDLFVNRRWLAIRFMARDKSLFFLPALARDRWSQSQFLKLSFL